jgi:hypothetical protein
VPKVFRGEESRGYTPDSIQKYQSRSMVQEYRGVAIVFAIIGLGLAAYFVKSLLRGPHVPPPPPPQSVYIEVVPRKADPPTSP